MKAVSIIRATDAQEAVDLAGAERARAALDARRRLLDDSRLFVLRIRHAYLSQELRREIGGFGAALAPQAIDAAAIGV